MASISGTTSNLGNTSLRGYGGLMSGIDRDSIIEQMSLGSVTKIQNQKNAITSLTWKQEAYRDIINQILDIQDKYLSYSATNNLTDPSLFMKNVITPKGDEKVTKYVSASGSSNLLDMMSVRGVEQLATSANLQSDVKGTGAIETGKQYEGEFRTSKLQGTSLIFGSYGTEDKFNTAATFTFSSSYRDENGKTVEIDYETTDMEKLERQLNEMVKANEFKVDDGKTIQFEWDETNERMCVNYHKVTSVKGQKFEIGDKITGDNATDTVVRSNSSALTALGLDKDNVTEDGISGEKIDGKKGYTLAVLNANTKNFKESSVKTDHDMATYLSGKKFTITYGGQSRSLELITKDDLADIKKMVADNPGDPDIGEKAFLTAVQNNLDKAFGRGKIEVKAGANGIEFDDATSNGNTLTISSSSKSVMRQMGIDKLNSNKVSLENSLWDNRERLGLDGLVKGSYDLSTDEGLEAAKKEFNSALANFTINGVTIKGLNADMTVNQMVSKINASDAGVKATYLSTSNKFSLISTETGSGRSITLGEEIYDPTTGDMTLDGANPDRSGDVAYLLFGGAGMDRKDGEDAIMYVDFGTGEPQKMVSSSNTFELDGLKVTVSGTFGGTKEADGSFKLDNTQAVTFDASADTDKVTEKVKKFIEDYNALVKAINTQITTKPDKSYGPLSDAQKDEMDETSIENWEKKAKEGLLYNDSIMRDLSMDISGVMNQMLGGGVTYEDLEEMGITMSEDLYDGGTLVFDEEKFKAAMNEDPEKVGRVFTGGDGVSKGLTTVVGDTLKQYATRYRYLNNNSYGRLVEEAGSDKMTLSLQNNTIYKQLKDMQETLTTLQTRLKSEQDRYIKQFTYMEQAISNMNSQSSYLSSLGG
ncbi:MAG: flagellar filament capping protein FliD [Lachnospiraceae bacterium]|nr:flagellar filament capping protein FliD [Lachnospiraceae bacterium]